MDGDDELIETADDALPEDCSMSANISILPDNMDRVNAVQGVQEMDEDALPEDCSIFANISNRPDNVSSDHLVMDSSMDESFPHFSSTMPENITSTPSVRRSTRNRGTSSPAQSPSGSPARSTRSSTRGTAAAIESPSRVTRNRGTASPTQSPSGSPARSTRSSTRAASAIESPSRVTRSASRAAAASPTPTASTSRGTRATATGVTTTCGSPSRVTTRGGANVSTAPSLNSRSRYTRDSEPQQETSKKFKCPKCPSKLANKKKLDTHLRAHLMQGVTSRAPSYEKLLSEMPELVIATLNELESEPVIGHLSQLCHDYVGHLKEKFTEDVTGDASEMCSFLSYSVIDILREKKALFPSSIRSSMYSGTNKLLPTKEFLVEMTGFLTAFHDGEESVINVVLGNFVFILSKKTLVFVVKTMQGCAGASRVERRKRSEDDINSIEFRQLVYHIGGCIVSGFLWKGKQYSENSQTWSSFCDVLQSKFLRSEDRSDECTDSIRAFTDGMDRGGLKHISDAAFDYFLVLFDFLMSQGSDDGSLPADVIDNYVLQNDVLLCLWDVLVSDYLSEMDSLDLLVQMAEKAVKITIKGIMKRRLNEGLTKAYDSVAMRARLAK